MEYQQLKDKKVVTTAKYIDYDFNSDNRIVAALQREFGRYIDQGYLNVVASSPNFYPDFLNVELSFEDSAEHIIRRSKQTLDDAYLITSASGI